MKRIFLVSALLFVFYSFSLGIEGITMENYPRMDGSTSTEPLNRVIAKNLLEIDFDSIVYDPNNQHLPNFGYYLIEMTIHINDGNGNIKDIFYPRIVYQCGAFSLGRYVEYKLDESLRKVSWHDNYECDWKEEDIDLCTECFIEGIDKVYWTMGEGKKYNPENFLGTRVKSSQTHNAIINVIDNATDITLSARTMSDDEKVYAQNNGVTLIETPIALDAFVFLKNESNPITSLTIEQIQGIYTGKITNWKQVGGNDAEIIPYVRNQNSGSQELMNQLVLSGFPIPDYPEDIVLTGMDYVYSCLTFKPYGICYTVYYYDENKLWAPEKRYYYCIFNYSDGREPEMIKGSLNYKGEITESVVDPYEYMSVQKIAVNGIYPQYSTIKDNTYPFVAPVYAIIRSDLDKNSMAYKVYEWLQTEEGKSVIEQSGYIAYPAPSAVDPILIEENIQIFPNPTSGIVHTSIPAKIKVYSSEGILLQETFGSQVDLSTYPPGLYLFGINNFRTKVVKK